MTNMQFPVLASLALLGACSYEVSIGGGGGETTFDQSQVTDLVRRLGRETFGKVDAVRCPTRVQFVPFDRFTCEVDAGGMTHKAWVRFGLPYRGNADWEEWMMGGEILARDIETRFAGHPRGQGVDITCDGVLITAAHPRGRCSVSNGQAIDIDIVDGTVQYTMLEPETSKL